MGKLHRRGARPFVPPRLHPRVERRSVPAPARGRSPAAQAAARGAGNRAARRRHRAAAHRRGLRIRAGRAFLLAPRPAHRARTRALVLRLRRTPRLGRPRSRRARVRGSRAAGHPHAHRLARSARSRRRHRRCRIRPGHPRPAHQGRRAIFEKPPRPRGGFAPRALDPLAQTVEGGRRPLHRGDRQPGVGALSALCARLVALGIAAVRALPLPLRAPRHSRPASRGSARGHPAARPRDPRRYLPLRAVRALPRPRCPRRAPHHTAESAGSPRSPGRRVARSGRGRRVRPGPGHPADLALGSPDHPRRPARLAAAEGAVRTRLDARILRAELRPRRPPRPRSAQPQRAGRNQRRLPVRRLHRPGRAPSEWRHPRSGSQDRKDPGAEARVSRRGRGAAAVALRLGRGEEGEVLQPLLYGLAAEKILGEPVAFGRLYYSTIAQNYATIDVPLNDWTRQRAEKALHLIDDAIRTGFLPAAPRKDGCKRCEYLPVCGPYEEERIREKSQPELKDLKELRTWR
ncbi:hypothetical protein SBA4_360046 [Candidatus Sulfopaludibacter sp. SbA4]|nr:hypothetical protein SBA4_360046 [Candidatus Sulfopaludibacter sp. SbA4]